MDFMLFTFAWRASERERRGRGSESERNHGIWFSLRVEIGAASSKNKINKSSSFFSHTASCLLPGFLRSVLAFDVINFPRCDGRRWITSMEFYVFCLLWVKTKLSNYNLCARALRHWWANTSPHARTGNYATFYFRIKSNTQTNAPFAHICCLVLTKIVESVVDLTNIQKINSINFARNVTTSKRMRVSGSEIKLD